MFEKHKNVVPWTFISFLNSKFSEEVSQQWYNLKLIKQYMCSNVRHYNFVGSQAMIFEMTPLGNSSDFFVYPVIGKRIGLRRRRLRRRPQPTRRCNKNSAKVRTSLAEIETHLMAKRPLDFLVNFYDDRLGGLRVIDR